MFLTYQFAPIWATLVSIVTFLILRRYDPVDLSEYTEKMHGIPPIACCSAIAIPMLVLVAYDATLKLGPRPSRNAIKM
ncbi:hypothetical protein NESM_000780700 [Novymonas esmeraldas]|uniref:Uncharacterized protein n=1 Tax=Novymonas esmeraldas TaxID=1808958 RepID=A0AAW0EYY5_9TRYP